MSVLPVIKMNFPIEFFQKTYSEDERGGRIIGWKSLGQGWGDLRQSRARYPLVFENQRHYRGAVYDVIVKHSRVVNQADKIVYNHQDLFYLYSPQWHSKGFVKIRLFAWEKHTDTERAES